MRVHVNMFTRHTLQASKHQVEERGGGMARRNKGGGGGRGGEGEGKLLHTSYDNGTHNTCVTEQSVFLGTLGTLPWTCVQLFQSRGLQIQSTPC